MRLVHVGFHKTATSWLQRSVLPSCEGAAYIRPRIAGTEAQQYALKALVQTPPEEPFDVAKHAAAIPADALVSYEDLLGHPWPDPRHVMTMEGILDRLAALMPDAAILLTTREPDDWHRSLHAEYVRGGGTASRRRFVGSLLRPDYADVATVLERLRRRFHRVDVLRYEDLVRDPVLFVARIAELSGTRLRILGREPVYPSLRSWRLTARRGLNVLGRRG